MKKILCSVAALGLVCLSGAPPAQAVSQETAMLLQLLQNKGVITSADAVKFKRTIDQAMAAREKKEEAGDHYHSVRSMAQRIEKLEKTVETAKSGQEPLKKVNLSGVLAVDAVMSREKAADGTATESSDLLINTAELDVDAQVNKYVGGHVAFLYEEDDSNRDGSGIRIDEAIVNIQGAGTTPLYLKAGKMYLPFGSFESHFITDPQTLVLGRTNDTALIVGYGNSMWDVNVGAFRGQVKKTGDDNKIDSLVSNVTFTLPDNVVSGLHLRSGISYTSNLAASDTLQGVVTTAGEVHDMTAGFSAFAHMEYNIFTLDLEYLGAIDNFADNDLSFTASGNTKPAAWNIETAAKIMPKLELALRYGGSSDTGDHANTSLAQAQYGTALLYDMWDDTSIIFEYLHDEYKNNDHDNQATLELAVQF